MTIDLSSPLLSLEDIVFIRKREGSLDTSIGPLSLQVEEGEFLSLLGPSGAGKTTLLEIIAGLQAQLDGRVVLEGEEVPSAGRRIQLVFQDDRLLPWKTVKGNLQFASKRGREGERLEELLSLSGLAGKKKSWPEKLSGGERSRVSLIRALVDPPRILLLDEPFRNLDLIGKWRLQERFLEIIRQENVTCIMVSHSVRDAVFFSDRILVLSRAPMKVVKEVKLEGEAPRERTSRVSAKYSQMISRILEDASERYA